MAKKFVRGVTGVEDIESFDKTLTNVNDIVSDGQDTYVHTKKGKTESYYKLTDSVKQVESSDELLTITKEDGTVSIANSGLATKEELATKQGTLTTGDGLNINNNVISIEPKATITAPNKNGLYYGNVVSDGAPYNCISLKTDNSKYVQLAFRNSVGDASKIVGRYRFIINDEVTPWQEMLIDNQTIMNYLARKQDTLSSNTSIGVLSNNQLRQLFFNRHTYAVTNGFLKTHVKSVSENTSVNAQLEEFNFTVKIKQNAQNIVVTLNEHDTTAFTKIMATYGSNNSVRISGCVFSLSGSSLTISTTNNTNQNYVITFSDILD